jgi:predicted nucleic acid-binding protein
MSKAIERYIAKGINITPNNEKVKMIGYMFDTNIFNQILDGSVNIDKLNSKVFYATHVQLDEIRATPDAERRAQLESLFSQVIDEQIATESFVAGVSRAGRAKVSDGIIYNRLLQRLNKLNKSKANNVQDVLIGESAIANHLILVTFDHHLSQAVTEFGGKTCDLQGLREA